MKLPMKQISFLTLALAILCVFSSARPVEKEKKLNVETPDMERIRSEVTNPASDFFYPKLMKKYENPDTNAMTAEDYRYLYLGAVFQEDYDPYRHSDYSERIDDFYFKDSHSRSELDSIITYAELSLADTPFDLEQMNYLIYALRGRGKTNRANIWQYRLNHILQAIASTGTGVDKEHAWFVIHPRHEYNFVNFQNRIVDSQEYMPPYYDYIRLKRDSKQGDKAPDGYYFNIRNLLEEYYRKHPEQR
ncbi:MAG: DUF4919 domain-containing protein [Muribaculaceae bacterium]|nr:DUF4919 domain-containing protein [Muribaculaceae bacterium]